MVADLTKEVSGLVAKANFSQDFWKKDIKLAILFKDDLALFYSSNLLVFNRINAI